jgi:hypothetical protein
MPKTAFTRKYSWVRAPTARPGLSHPADNGYIGGFQNTISPQQVNSEEMQRLWRMRWFFAIIIALWLLAAMIVTVVVLCLTRNLSWLSLFSTLAPPVYFLHRFAKYLLPKDERDYQLAMLKVLRQQRGTKGFHSKLF